MNSIFISETDSPKGRLRFETFTDFSFLRRVGLYMQHVRSRRHFTSFLGNVYYYNFLKLFR